MQKVDIIAALDVESVYGGRGRRQRGRRAGRQAGRQAGRTQEGGGRWAVDLNIYNAAAAAAASDSLLLRKLESSVSRMLPQPPPCIVRHRLRWKFVIKTYYMYKENERG